MKIYFVRHAQYANPRGIYPGRLPVPLSQEGRSEAERLQKYFADKKIQRIYSSAVLRCKQTSQIIANETIETVFDPRLLETFSAYQGFWALEGDNTHASWDQFYSHRDELGGENYTDVLTRMINFFQHIQVNGGERIIVCSHGDPLHLLYLHLSGEPQIAQKDDVGELGNPDYLQKGWIRPCEFENGHCTFEPMISQNMLKTLFD